jgi:hypothetical protein
MLREVEPGVANRTADAIAALAHARIGQADHRQARQPERDVDFDDDGGGVDAEDGGGAHAREHGGAPLQGKRRVQDRRSCNAAF